MSQVLDLIKDRVLTFEQKVVALARAGEATLNVLNITDEVQDYRDKGIICDLFEGNAPYRPRYIVPNYSIFMEKGCSFLRLDPPTNIWEATNHLLIFYKHVPSITTMPVYVGNLDALLDPFIVDEEEAYQAIKLFFIHLDRTITDSFCHGNLGPTDSKAARIILKVQRELQDAVPNLTLKFNEDTSKELATLAINTAMACAKPSFANHDMFTKDLGDYGIVSCYNGLPIGGGSHSLVRLVLSRLAEEADSVDHFLTTVLPDATARICHYMDQRVKFLVEESGFFESHFLVKEGFISKDKFTSMFGLVGLAECVNVLLDATDKKDRFGHNKEADALGLEIIKTLQKLVDAHPAPYCTNERYLLHAQVGIDTDIGVSPGCRIPVGEEPEIHQHLIQSAPFHQYFPSGIGDIFVFDETAEVNPEYVLDIIKGSFTAGLRYFSLYGSDVDVMRITGYLVKKSDMEALAKGEQVLHDTVVLGLGGVNNNKVLERKVRNHD